MLKNELCQIKELIEEVIIAVHDELPVDGHDPDEFFLKIQKAFVNVRDAWCEAAFSTTDDLCLKRYYGFHLEGVREILDTLPYCAETDQFTKLLRNQLLTLINYQRQYFGDYFNYNAIAPSAFCEMVTASTRKTLDRLKIELANNEIDVALRDCLLAYFKKADFAGSNTKYTFGALFYFERFINELNASCFDSEVTNLSGTIVRTLTDLNFNAIDFFCYRKQAIEKSIDHFPLDRKVKLLHEEIDALTGHPEIALVYDQRFPGLHLMLKNWLSEELAIVNEMLSISIAVTASDKLSLNLSVAHLACLTRLFFEENVFNAQALTTIFKFIAGNYQTKRQNRISTGSLSKEYYSVSQVTAAVVRDKLLKMVTRLNRDYFPAVVVTGAATLLYSILR